MSSEAVTNMDLSWLLAAGWLGSGPVRADPLLGLVGRWSVSRRRQIGARARVGRPQENMPASNHIKLVYLPLILVIRSY